MDKVVHFEIPVDDAQRAQEFYTQVFDWKIDKVSGEIPYFMVYTVPVDENQMPKESGAINGGMFQRDESGKTPIIVINVSSIDESLEKIEKAGGKVVVPKMQVGEMGLYARVQDSEGNIIGIWENLH